MNATPDQAALATVGVDLAKDAFQLSFADADWRIVQRKRLSRSRFAAELHNRAPLHVVMEACGSAHYWGRLFARQGHRVTLLPAHQVKPYVLRRKTDRTDADALIEAVREEILKPVLPAKWLHKGTKYHINPTGKFEIGGPVGDCGLTGRKIIVDTYGGWARHGGGAFSGKDPSKVDRSAAYAARYVAKNIVAAGLADRCEVQLSYAIGVAEPTSISVTTFGTGKVSDTVIEKLIRRHFDLRPYGIIRMLDLVHPIYQRTASYGHFGRKPEEVTYVDAAGKQQTATAFSWEKTDKAEELRKAARIR